MYPFQDDRRISHYSRCTAVMKKPWSITGSVFVHLCTLNKMIRLVASLRGCARVATTETGSQGNRSIEHNSKERGLSGRKRELVLSVLWSYVKRQGTEINMMPRHPQCTWYLL